MQMSIPPGLYHISSVSNLQVNRHPIEDRSFLPKRVLVLPEGVKPLAPWRIEPVGDGLYTLRALGALTAERDGLLWAFLMEEDREYRWVITPRGNGYYTIETPARDAGWVAAGEDDPWGTQIAVKPLTSGGSMLFRFERIVE